MMLNGKPVTLDNTKLQAISFIRGLVEFASTLDVLPDDRFLTLKLTYYDDRTPIDYEPMFFTKADAGSYSMLTFPANAVKVKVAKLETSDHSLSLQYTGMDSFLNEDIGSGFMNRGMSGPYTNPNGDRQDQSSTSSASERREEKEKDDRDDDEESFDGMATGGDIPIQHDTDADVGGVNHADQVPVPGSDLESGSVASRIREYILTSQNTNQRECHRQLGLKQTDVKNAFVLLEKLGLLRKRHKHQGGGYSLLPQYLKKGGVEALASALESKAAFERIEARSQTLPPINSQSQSQRPRLEQNRPEEEEEVEWSQNQPQPPTTNVSVSGSSSDSDSGLGSQGKVHGTRGRANKKRKNSSSYAPLETQTSGTTAATTARAVDPDGRERSHSRKASVIEEPIHQRCLEE
jgi:hypothetical protein